MSLNIVNKTTGSITQVAGNVDDSGIGNLDALHTENKSSLVSAINEVGTTFKGTQYDWNQLTLAQKTSFDRAIITDDYAPLSIGNLSSLTTTDKSSVVGAINEVNSKNASQISYNNTTSGMTASNVQGAVDELKSGLTNKVLGRVDGQLTACKIMSYSDYTDNNEYNVWTEHSYTIAEFTKISSVFLRVININLPQVIHEVELKDIINNTFTYAVKAGWSGGISGVTVIFVAIGI